MSSKIKPSDHASRTTIRNIVILVGIVLAGTWVAVAFSLVTSRQHELDDASSESRNLMVAFREEIGLILGGVEAEMNKIAQQMRRERGNFDLYDWGRENVLVLPGMAQATFAGPDGKVRSTTVDRRPSATNLSDREHFRIHLDGKFHGLYFGQPILGRISFGAPFLPISRRVEAEDGTFLGVLVIVVSPGALTTLHKSIDLGAHGVITLAGLDHLILARFSADSPDGTKGIGASVAGDTRPDNIKENAEGWYVRPARLTGSPGSTPMVGLATIRSSSRSALISITHLPNGVRTPR